MATASSPVTDNLRCAICKEIFTEPVSLNCQHTFCKSCIEQSLKTRQQCPLCGSRLFTDRTFEINKPKPKPRIKTKPKGLDHSHKHGERGDRTTAEEDTCSKHNEILQLFCVTDKQLICVVCRDGKAHKGHKFKPVKEAQDDFMEKIVSDLIYLQEDIKMVSHFLESEQAITESTRERNIRLKADISLQFKELGEKLRLREQQAMKEIEEMNMAFEMKLLRIQDVLAEGWERQAIIKSALDIAQPREFVNWWLEKGEAEAGLVRDIGSLQGPLMKKCPPASPQKPWTKDLPATQSKTDLKKQGMDSILLDLPSTQPVGTELENLHAFMDLEDHLCCPICTEMFTEPVSLDCQHTFCKSCIEQSLKTLQQCPICRSALFRDKTFEINRTLKNMVDDLKVDQRRQKITAGRRLDRPRIPIPPKQELKPKPQSEREIKCSEHGEILQLFCEIDQQLICVVCRDGRDHRGHTFQPVQEAQQNIIDGELASAISYLREDVSAVVGFLERERLITARTRERNVGLRAEIGSLFDELTNHLRLTEEQAMKEIEQMDLDFEMKLVKIEKVLEEAKNREATLKSGMDLAEPRNFLLWWTEKGQAEAVVAMQKKLYLNDGDLQKPLMRKCPLPSPEKPWTKDLFATQSNLATTKMGRVIIPPENDTTNPDPAGTQLEGLLGSLNLEVLKRRLFATIYGTETEPQPCLSSALDMPLSCTPPSPSYTTDFHQTKQPTNSQPNQIPKKKNSKTNFLFFKTNKKH
ncbi:hypothetical protein DPEC_G00234900 [Dallia pectoralis]|uniref:Uncharacterized protein n=1 Tax=Dallia pectoralis TaxID=75939 RepID=A0ACC2FY47_DALPE|nr:hypothetical protein DPEC_G00234900 [Dallia pectoralis]